MDSANPFAKYCDACELREACEYTFGVVWKEMKSNGGIGCRKPINSDPKYIQSVLAAKRIRECAAVVKPGAVPTAAITRNERREADFMPHHKYIVTHKGAEYETAAKSVSQAINYIRYKLYGQIPLSALPPFSARAVVESATADKPKTLSKSDALARLRRMAK